MLSSELVRSVLDSAPDAMIIIDAQGTVIFANRQVTALFGHNRAAIVGQPVEVLLPERFRHRHSAHRSGYSSNVRIRPMGMGLELFGMRGDGSEFPVEISLSPIQENGETLVAAAIRDVSERKRAEAALREARLEAEHANLAKSRFLATASHDLRQPLQTLGLLSGALRRTARDAESQDILQQQDDAIDAMSRLLNALLDISKLESGAIKLELTDFPVDALFDELRRDFANLAATKKLRLAFDYSGLRVHSDPALLGQLLRNLVSNAIKYTPSGAVEVRCVPRGDHLRIEVVDSGVGIAPDQLSLIFEEFYQVGVSPNSTREGYGLGLSIVRRIVKLLGIDIDVTSEPGRGSVFSVDVPVAKSADGFRAAPTAPAPDPNPRTVNARILLVEDDARVRAAMRTFLKAEGFEVVAAATSEEAMLELQGDSRFDLLITDYHLESGNTGTQVIAAARGATHPELAAILITGDTSAAVREIEVDAALRIASKPINSTELRALMQSLLMP